MTSCHAKYVSVPFFCLNASLISYLLYIGFNFILILIINYNLPNDLINSIYMCFLSKFNLLKYTLVDKYILCDTFYSMTVLNKTLFVFLSTGEVEHPNLIKLAK